MLVVFHFVYLSFVFRQEMQIFYVLKLLLLYDFFLIITETWNMSDIMQDFTEDVIMHLLYFDL